MRKLNRSLGGFFDILRGLCVARIGLGQGGRRRPRAVKETTLTLTLALALALTLTQVANVSHRHTSCQEHLFVRLTQRA